VFRYSKRKDTPAAEMDDQLPERVKEERNQDLLSLVNEIAMRKNDELIGQQVEILCEGPSRRNSERLSGRTRTNKIVIIDGKRERFTGQLFDVCIEENTGYTLYGNPVLAD
jgi:tRNA-2-methylthio-N6-dimethylallyladenosine synthase